MTPGSITPRGSKVLLFATPSWLVVNERGRLDMFSLTISLLFLKIFTQSRAVTPAQTKLYPKYQGKGSFPNTHYCSYLGNGNTNHGSHPALVRNGNCTPIGPALSRQPKGFSYPYLCPHASSPLTQNLLLRPFRGGNPLTQLT